MPKIRLIAHRGQKIESHDGSSFFAPREVVDVLIVKNLKASALLGNFLSKHITQNNIVVTEIEE